MSGCASFLNSFIDWINSGEFASFNFFTLAHTIPILSEAVHDQRTYRYCPVVKWSFDNRRASDISGVTMLILRPSSCWKMSGNRVLRISSLVAYSSFECIFYKHYKTRFSSDGMDRANTAISSQDKSCLSICCVRLSQYRRKDDRFSPIAWRTTPYLLSNHYSILCCIGSRSCSRGANALTILMNI